MDFQREVSGIIADRQRNLPGIAAEIEKIDGLRQAVKKQREVLIRIMDSAGAPPELGLERTIRELLGSLEELKKRKVRMVHLRKRFERPTVNIGVSGQARVGKSTLLQTISGLEDDQIPTGVGLPVTAVHSRIFNQGAGEPPYAIISFHTEESFFEDYVKAHLEQLKNLSPQVYSLAEFMERALPASVDGLNEASPMKAAYSLKKLAEAQQALRTPELKKYLRGELKTISNLKELRPFVAYPTNDEINSGAAALRRLYLAVRDVEIRCPFPALPGGGFGLVDLPGLGEAGDRVAKMHLDGLENEVDHVALLLRPTDTGSFVGKALVENIDQLSTVQPDIGERGAFVSILINKDPDAERKGLVKNLWDDVNRQVNDGQSDSKYKVHTLNVKDKDDVNGMLERVLEALTKNLPLMDRRVLEAAFARQAAVEKALSEALSSLRDALRDLNRRYPSDRSQLVDDAEHLQKNLAKALEEFKGAQRENLKPQSNTATADQQAYFAEVEKIYRANEEKIADGLWKGAAWDEDAAKSIASGKGPQPFFQDECNRLRVKIAVSFEQMNGYYECRLDGFLKNLTDVFWRNTGAFVPSGVTGHKAVEAIVEKLRASSHKMENLESAFAWLAEIKFDFRQNVFPAVRDALNAIESYIQDRDPQSLLDGIRFPPGLNEQTAMLKKLLQSHADEANYQIAKSLKDCDGIIEKFIFAALEHFDDYAIRAEGWRKEYMELCAQFRDEIWPGRYTDINTEAAVFKEAAAGIDSILALIQGKKE